MNREFYIRHGGRTQGPYSIEKLHELARRGRFSRADQVSSDRLTWQRASELAELFPEASSSKVRIPRSAPVGARSGPDSSPEVKHRQQSQENEASSYSLQEPSAQVSNALWYYTIDDVDHEPISLDELQARVSQGHLKPNDQIWTEGMSDWMAASQVRELSPLFSSSRLGDSDPAAIKPNSSGPHISPKASAIQTAPMAVASLVLGLLGTNVLFFLGSILAVVFGHIALRQIRESGDHLGGRGLAIAGLIFGYAVIIITVVVGIVFFLALLLGFVAAAGNGP